jgi:hypothetical protein
MNKPKAPTLRHLNEGQVYRVIGVCGRCHSSFKKKFIIFKTKKCINPECENYYGKPPRPRPKCKGPLDGVPK